ncbi:helix-turn-helix domain-containing protein [Micromonospora sp. DT227]|uniref:helix-turn-helix domain-containing protein n=1 Tax=Micromonospora sp. DT227 TaxID=3393433 RepID=UPI003CEAF5F5
MSPSPPSGPRQLGPLLAELRAARGWSQQRIAAELCAAAGVPTLTRHEVSRWERQLRLPGDFWSVWLARVLGVPGELITEAAARSRRLRRGPAGHRPGPAAGSTGATDTAVHRPEPAAGPTGPAGPARPTGPTRPTGPAGATEVTGRPDPTRTGNPAAGPPPEPASATGATDTADRSEPAPTGNPAAGPPPGPADTPDKPDTARRPARGRGGTRAAGRPGRHSGARRGRPRPPARTGRPPQPAGPGSGRARAVPRRTARRGGDEAGPAGTD